MRKSVFYLSVFLALASFIFGSDQVYKKETLYDSGKIREFTGKDLGTIAFPIGGLGTGNITLGGRGEIRELEIFNRPDKGKSPDFTFFSIWAREEEKQSVARILERQFFPPYIAWMGIPRNQLPGVSRFEEVVFKGEYPFASLKFEDEEIPVEVMLEAYNPLIPLSPEKSGIPAAVFYWKIKNEKSSPVSVSLAFSMMNPIKTVDKAKRISFGKNLNQFIDDGRFRGIKMTSNRGTEEDVEFGSIAFVTVEKEVDVQTRWYRGGWWDNAHIFWDDFSDDGRLTRMTDSEESPEGRSDVATLLVHIELRPGEEKIVPFYLTWYFPNRDNYWNREEEVKSKRFKNYYASKFQDAWDVARHFIRNEKELYPETKTFHDTLVR
ncbi:MAG: hypothetical protein JSV46_02930 [Candidatus Aminicenantes bacterium]|nr:MAG: hypothetical protein JSV46_02930 [Candidatus Aminicenantes bacterium]